MATLMPISWSYYNLRNSILPFLILLLFNSHLLSLLVQMLLDILNEILVMLYTSLDSQLIAIQRGCLLQLIHENVQHLIRVQSSDANAEDTHLANEVLLLQYNTLIVNTKFQESLVWNEWIVFVSSQTQVNFFEENLHIEV
jgi:hypothetical protein